MKIRSIRKHVLYMLAVIFIVGGIASCKESKKIDASQGYYTCSMHTQVRKQEPGLCPICGMKLTYVEAMKSKKHKGHAKSHKMGDSTEKNNAESKGFVFQISSTVLGNSNLVTMPAHKVKFARKTNFSAHIGYNEDPNRLVIINTKYDGWVERLYVSKEGQYVYRGKALMGIYSPSILAAKEEYATTYSSLKTVYNSKEKLDKDPTLGAARRKLINLDISMSQIKKLEKGETISRRSYYTSPISGVVIKKSVLQGAFIKAGQEVLRIANLSKLWVYVHIYEKDLPFVKKGQYVKLRTRAYPDKEYKGRIDLIYPFLDMKSKDIKVRIVVNNYRNTLKPGMFGNVDIYSQLPGKHIVIPDTAVVYSGDETYVFVSQGDGQFQVRTVKVKVSSNGKAVISEGIEEKELVVVNGQFLLDSEASLKQAVSKGQKVGHNH